MTVSPVSLLFLDGRGGAEGDGAGEDDGRKDVVVATCPPPLSPHWRDVAARLAPDRGYLIHGESDTEERGTFVSCTNEWLPSAKPPKRPFKPPARISC